MLRYGENPHQTRSALPHRRGRPGVATARQVQGKQLSYNNINDTDAAFELVAEFDPTETAAVAIIKHANPCGVATADPGRGLPQGAPHRSGVGVRRRHRLNRPLDADAATEIVKIFTEVIIAPGASHEADRHPRRQEEPPPPARPARMPDRGRGPDGALRRRRPAGPGPRLGHGAPADLTVVTRRAPPAAERPTFCSRGASPSTSSRTPSSRADGATAAIGAGQMSRVESAMIAARKAAEAGEAAGLGVCLAAVRGSV